MHEVLYQDILDAQQRIKPFVHRTPVITNASIDRMVGCRVFFKCENFQRVGAFKYRGATNAVQKLSERIVERGVVTHSSGNHAQALALAAKTRNVEAHIVMPSNAPAVKKRAVAGYGATIYECKPTLDARESTAQRVIDETGATFVHPYNDPDVIAGQGTCVLELIDDVPGDRPLDAVIAPIGGGGLISGTCIAGKAGSANIRVFGSEPAGADDAARSLAAGEFIPQTGPQTIADGLLTSMGTLTWPIIREHVESIFTVGDTEIIFAMRLVWERMKIVIEPSSAVPVAAILSEAFRSLGGISSVGVILTGGNVDLDRLPWMA